MENEDYLFSAGTHAAYQTLYRRLIGMDDPADQVLINLSTIVRNICQSGAPAQRRAIESGETTSLAVMKQNMELIRSEIQTFITEVAIMLHNRPSAVERIILAYWYDYDDMIPKEYRRSVDPVLTSMLSRIRDQYQRGKLTTYTYQGIKIYDTYLAGKNIVSTLKGMIESFQNEHKVLMLSHHPIDYHVAQYCDTWAMVTSYTGQYITPDQLGQYVFKLELPFTKPLHILLGDRQDLKRVITPKKKQELLQAAQEESWYLLPEEKVQERLQQLSLLTPYTF